MWMSALLYLDHLEAVAQSALTMAFGGDSPTILHRTPTKGCTLRWMRGMMALSQQMLRI